MENLKKAFVLVINNKQFHKIHQKHCSLLLLFIIYEFYFMKMFSTNKKHASHVIENENVNGGWW